MWVQGRYGAADPIDSVRTAASASSRPALAVTDILVPTKQAHRAVADRVGHSGMAHHPRHAKR